MKYKILFASIFVLLALFVAYTIKPKTKEMVYVYEKSKNLKKLNEEYKKIIKDKPEDLILLKKLADNSYKINDKKYLNLYIKYYNQKKDYEVIRKIIDTYKVENDFDNAINWLKTAYNDFDRIEELNEIIAISSSSNKKEVLKTYLKKLYLRTNDTKILFTLYGLNEKEYALQRIYTLMENGQLNKQEYEKGLILSIYEKDLEIAYNFYAKKNLDKLDTLKHEKEYTFMLQNLQKTEDIIKLEKHLYKKTKDNSYFKKLTDILLYEGDIDEYLAVVKRRYEEEKRVSDLKEIIKYNYLNEDIGSYLEYLSKKAILEKDIVTSESIIAYYIDLGEEKTLLDFLKKLTDISKKYDEFKDLALRTYAYLGMNEIAEKLLLQFPAKEISPNAVYSVFNRKINEKSMPYFMEILKNSKDTITKGKLFKYRYKTLRLFTDETYKYFGKPSTFKKLYKYVEQFSNKDKNKNLLKFANKSSDPMFISEIAQYFLFKNKKNIAIPLFKRALTLYANNKLSLKNLAILYLYNNKQDESLKLLLKLKKLDSSDIEVDYYLAEYYHIKNNKKEYEKYYNNVINNLAIKSLKEKFMILRAKSKLSSPINYKNELHNLIKESKNDINLISDIWYLFYQDKKYNYLTKEFKKFRTLIKKNYRLQEIELITYMALNKNKIAKDKISNMIKNTNNSSELAVLYERLGSIEYKNFNKASALKNYEKSLSLKHTKENENFTNNLKKEFKTKIDVSVGVRSDIKEIHLNFRKLIKKIKVNLTYDSFDDYSSPKVNISDLDEKYLFGIGKDYLKIGFQYLFREDLTIFLEKNIDTASKSTIDNRLKYNRFSLDYTKAINQNLFYNLKADYYKYNNFNRKRFENSLYIPFNKTYFTSLSYTKENVSQQNIYGYETENRYILALGENDKISDKMSYFYSLGGEDNEKDTTYFINFDLYYNNRDYDISLKNSFSKDPLNSNYNLNSMLNFSYYF